MDIGTTEKAEGYARTPLRGDPGELNIEQAMTGGYENPVQELPTGEGHFVFVTCDPGRTDSFETDNADKLIARIYRELGPVDIIRTYGYTWSVEDEEGIVGTIAALPSKPCVLAHESDEGGNDGLPCGIAIVVTCFHFSEIVCSQNLHGFEVVPFDVDIFRIYVVNTSFWNWPQHAF